MKKFSKLFAAILVIALMAALAVPAFAAGTGTITINNAVVGQVYTVYKMADLESYDPGAGNYSYKVNDYWKAFFQSHSVNVDETNHIEYTSTIVNATNFAAAAVAYATAPEANATNTPSISIVATSTTVVFENLDLGYYCIDSSQGAVCGLTNTNPDGTINEKNGTPIIEKYVKEDSSGDWEHTSDDHLGAVVPFRLEVTKVAGAVNYMVGDNLSDGLTLDPDLETNISVMFGSTPGVAGSTYTLYINSGDPAAWSATLTGLGLSAEQVAALENYEFLVDLDDAAVAAMVDGSEIIIDYTATINENAKVGTDGNPNEATLIYGNDPVSMLDPVKTITYVWDFQVFKYTNADSTKKPLAGAQFSIYETNPETDPSATAMWLKFIETDVNGVDIYEHVHNPADTTGLTQVITSNNTSAKFVIRGLDSGSYWMKEIAAPAGYHMLRSLVEVQIGIVGSYSDAVLDYTVANTVDGYIEILNSTGVVLPETGGIGTMIFIGMGSLLVVSMGVLLVVKKRMGQVVFTK